VAGFVCVAPPAELIEAMGIPASIRLRKPGEFQSVRSSGHRIHCGSFIFQSRVAPEAHAPRLGVIASRRVGNAVRRNYGKRIFREIFRHHASELPAGSELVIVLRKGFETKSFGELEGRFVDACGKLAASRPDGASAD